MTVIEAIAQLEFLRDSGYGDLTLRNYSELANETYPPAKFVLHLPTDDEPIYPETYGAWVEVA